MTCPKTVTANFTLINQTTYTLTVNVSPNGGGDAKVNGITPSFYPYIDYFTEGTLVNLEAIPANECWHFVNWTGGVTEPNSATTTIYMNGPKDVTAYFAKYGYTLTVNADPAEGGTVSGGGTYDCGTNVIVEATPADECWHFVNWTGGVAGPNSATTTVYINGPKDVTAHFARYSYTMTVSADPAEGGTVSGGGTYDCSTNVIVEAVPADECWYFVNWTGGVADPGSATTTVYMDGPKDITAHFAKYGYTLTVNADPAEGGAVSGGGTYDCGSNVIVEATPADECWYFVNWTGDVADPNSAVTTIHMDEAKTVTAHFAQITYTLTVDTSPSGGTVTLDPSPPAGGYVVGTEVTLTAVADEGYEFDHWSGALSGSENPTVITMDSDGEITAHFTEVTPPSFPWWWIVFGVGVVAIGLLFYFLVIKVLRA